MSRPTIEKKSTYKNLNLTGEKTGSRPPSPRQEKEQKVKSVEEKMTNTNKPDLKMTNNTNNGDDFHSHLVYLVKDIFNDSIVSKKGGTISINAHAINFSLTVLFFLISNFLISNFLISNFIHILPFSPSHIIGWSNARDTTCNASKY
jgi:hypothetical protein